MKRLLRNSSAIVLTSLLGSTFGSVAFAADQLNESTKSSYNWSGLSFGIGGGAGAVVHEVDVPPLGGLNFNGIGGEGVFGELTVGYDHLLTERLLIGVYGNYRFGEIETDLSIPAVGFNADITLDNGYDILGRLGYVLTPSTLGYVLGGYSRQEFDISATGLPVDLDFELDGWTAGAGLETVLKGNWTLKTEYRYSEYDDEDFGTGGILEITPSTHTAHASLVYRLNGGYTEAADVTPVEYDFTGWKLGLAFGAGAVVHEVDVPPLGGFNFNGIGGEGVFGEAGLGYDMDLGNNIILGVAGDVRFGSIDTELNIPALGGFRASVDADLGFDLIGRAGYLLEDNVLVYALGGYSYQEFDVDAGGLPIDLDFELNGWTAGGGIEVGVTDNLSTKLEYRYAEYSDEDFGTGGLLEITPSTHTVRLGVSRKLN